MSILRDEAPVGVVMKMRDLEGNIFRFTQRCATSGRKWRIAVSAVAVCCRCVLRRIGSCGVRRRTA